MKYPILLIFGILIWQLSYAQDPCGTKAHRQFDFWVGKWTVYKTGTDTIVGQNKINKILNGCVIEENWTGAKGFEGKSFNTYDQRDSTWNQVWVDMSGGAYHFKGRFQDHIMQMNGETVDAQGKPVLLDMSYHHDPSKGTVRQIWKMSNDSGSSWQTVFDGLYKKKETP